MAPTPLHTSRPLAAALLAALLTACGTVENLTPGMPRAEVLSRWGQPTRVVPVPGGERLQYSFQPTGQEAVMVDIDAAGRVVQARQVLNENDFARIALDGSWTQADIGREFGPPAYVGAVGRWDGPVWTYRWRGGMVDQMFYVYFDPAGRVRRTEMGMDPRQFRNMR
ncbi:hypothetical protein [Pseudorhodoferax soli]|uniref:Beta-barrel assembly machine subunit BamE n=1 Tax=Pseudorhodoferax soli TaxID=545864 RepID=A0A368Y3Y8_9BURK|nr:hypothetical protein [Pseudorhodoferax soli]RCW74439.1 hypothetical protein DES41_102762 [Pseudorhodoferax soli]